jgi:hypothetical protein
MSSEFLDVCTWRSLTWSLNQVFIVSILLNLALVYASVINLCSITAVEDPSDV